MLSSNHMLAGVAVAAFTKNPVIALPAALASHFVLDAFPHFGFPGENGFRAALRHPITRFVIVFDVLAWSATLYLALQVGSLALLLGLVAVSPDFVWLYHYIKYERYNKPLPSSWHTDFHRRIQWGERPWGIFIEVGVFTLMSTLLFRNIL